MFMGMNMKNMRLGAMDFVKRLQALMVASYLFVYFHYLSVFGTMSFFGMLFSPLFFLALAYAYWYYKTSDVPLKGGWNIKWIRNLPIWEYFRGYFPVSLYKTTDLDSTKNYIFAMHPFGLLNCGGMAFFATNSKEFQFKFPGLKTHMLVDKKNFLFPITREMLLLAGISAKERSNMEYILSNRHPWTKKGQVCALTLGEKEEFIRQEPGKLILVVKSRKDFIRAALKTGASIVPVFSFGEEALYKKKEEHKTLLRSIFSLLMGFFKLIYMIPAWFCLFRTSYGFMPMRKRIDVVVGRPIEVTKEDHPTEDQTNKLFDKYLNELESLFNENKKFYMEDKSTVLLFE